MIIHAMVYGKLFDYLTDEEREWLKEYTRAHLRQIERLKGYRFTGTLFVKWKTDKKGKANGTGLSTFRSGTHIENLVAVQFAGSRFY